MSAARKPALLFGPVAEQQRIQFSCLLAEVQQSYDRQQRLLTNEIEQLCAAVHRTKPQDFNGFHASECSPPPESHGFQHGSLNIEVRPGPFINAIDVHLNSHAKGAEEQWLDGDRSYESVPPERPPPEQAPIPKERLREVLDPDDVDCSVSAEESVMLEDSSVELATDRTRLQTPPAHEIHFSSQSTPFSEKLNLTRQSTPHSQASRGTPGSIQQLSQTWVRGETEESGETSNKSLSRSRSKSLEKSLPFAKVEKGGGRILRVVQSAAFESFFALMIFANAIIMALEIQYEGIDLGHTIEWPSSDRTAAETWPCFIKLLEVSGMFFTILFTIEVFVKVIGLNVDFVRDAWNWVDLLIVLISWIDTMTLFELPINSQYLRVLKLLRLTRLLKLVRTMKWFDSLYVMATALQGCASATLWSFALLFLMQLFIAQSLTQILFLGYFVDDSHSEEDKREVYEYFGTFTRTMLSMFELTLGNWIPICRLLSDNVSEWFVLFAICHKLTMGFAVVNVISGVFIQESFAIARNDDGIMMRQKQATSKVHSRKMRALFSHMDDNDDCKVDYQEWSKIFQQREVQMWLASMEIHAKDPELLFNVLSKGEGVIDEQSLADGTFELKGSASAFDVLVILKELSELKETLEKLRPPLTETVG